MATIWVAPARHDGRVALWERHPDHPGGEVYLAAGDAAREVGVTPLVLAKIREGDLLRVEPPTPPNTEVQPTISPAPHTADEPTLAPPPADAAPVVEAVVAEKAKPTAKRAPRVKETTDGAADSSGV